LGLPEGFAEFTHWSGPADFFLLIHIRRMRSFIAAELRRKLLSLLFFLSYHLQNLLVTQELATFCKHSGIRGKMEDLKAKLDARRIVKAPGV
jgi:hypothetical protein